jgi:hypothetical protein
VPEWLGEVMASAYPNRSIEGYRDYQCQQGHTHPFAITGLALLGVTPPGVGTLSSLEDIAALYDVAAAQGPGGSGEKWRISMPATKRPQRAISHAQAGAIVARTIARGAISEHRAEHYLALAAQGDDLSYLDELTAVEPSVRAAAPPPGATFSVNPLLDEMRQQNPALVQAAEAEDPNPPRLFGDRDLPPFTASGIDPHLPAGLPWALRRPVAAAPTMKGAYELIEKYAGAEPDDLGLLALRHSRANQDYVSAFSLWLQGSRYRNTQEPQGLGVTASAARDDAEKALYRSLFGKEPED